MTNRCEKKINLNKIKNYNTIVALNYLFSAAALILGFIATRIKLDYLGETLYGYWIVLTSIISWGNYGDFGIGNGLRNELSKAYANNDIDRFKKMFSIGLKKLRSVSVIISLVLFIICQTFLFLGILQNSLKIAMYVSIVFFGINLYLSVYNNIYYGIQKSYYITLLSCIKIVLSIISVVVLFQFRIKTNIVAFAFADGISLTLSNLIMITHIKRKFDLSTKKSINNSNIEQYSRKISNKGMQFFVIQLCALILFQTDSILINYFFSTEKVTEYSLITSIYNAGEYLFSILLISFWSSVTYYFEKNNISWIKKRIKINFLIWLVFCIGVIFVSLILNDVVKVLLGDNAYTYSFSMIILFSLYCMLNSLCNIFVNVINGIGKIKIELVVAVIEALINIPLSCYFAINCSFGIAGIKLGTFCCLLFSVVIYIIYTIYILRKKQNDKMNI